MFVVLLDVLLTAVSACLCCSKPLASEGLSYSMGGLTGNTRNSHRLLAWVAQQHGLDKQNLLAEALFNGYFCQVGASRSSASTQM